MMEYAVYTALVERSKGLFESNGSNTSAGVASEGGALIAAITLVNTRMASANAVLLTML